MQSPFITTAKGGEVPISTVTCSICLRTVSKRSTLALRELGGGDGRACRGHEEVATLVSQAEQKRLSHQQWRNANERLGIIVAAAEVRVRCSFQGFDPEVLYLRFQTAGVREGHLRQIRDEVGRLGGPVMTPEECCCWRRM